MVHRYWNISFHWLNQYNLKYKINYLDMKRIITKIANTSKWKETYGDQK